MKKGVTGKYKKQLENSKKSIKKHKKKLSLLFLLLVLILFLLFGTKIYLYVKFMMGNDIVIVATTEQENIFLHNGESKDVEIKLSTIANPFCSVRCNYTFKDISHNIEYGSSHYQSRSPVPITKTYTVSSNEDTTGQILYRFESECAAKKTFFCNTEEKIEKQFLLITLNHDLSYPQKITQEESKQEFLDVIEKYNNITKNIAILEERLNKSTEKFYYEPSINITEFKESKQEINNYIIDTTSLWENGGIIKYKTSITNNKIDILKNKINNANTLIKIYIDIYNNIATNISSIENKLYEYNNINLSENSLDAINNTITEFNTLKLSLLENKSILEIKNLFDNFYNNYSTIEIELGNQVPNFIINNITIDTIKTNENITINTIYELKDPAAICCLYKNCSKCCNQSCSSDEEKYPIVFIHGHDFSLDTSPMNNLKLFGGIQEKLEKELGIINAGYTINNVPKSTINGIWGENPNQFSITTSYYFESIENNSAFQILETKKDNIDTYAIRLNEIINTIKYKTNRDKVIIVSHSMGGLVTRRYLQIFGDDDIKTLIMITSPNNGINENKVKLCKIFGSETECDDMYENSIFINKIKNQKTPNIEIYNIIGIGCNTDNEKGDGIVTNKSAYLKYANNYYLEGNCSQSDFEYLHTEITDIEKYPETYNLIKEIISS